MGEYYYNGTNSKGEAKWRRNTNESIEFVEQYLDNLGIDYETHHHTCMLRIFKQSSDYSYYWTTGKWSPYVRSGLPKRHFSSNGIDDFINRFYNRVFEKQTHKVLIDTHDDYAEC